MPVELTLFAKGAVLGLSVSAPLGPIGVMCIRETLAQGIRSGFAVGLGAASADLIYAIVAAFGLTAVADALAPLAGGLRVVAAAILGGLAWRAFRTPATHLETVAKSTATASFITSFALLISNPAAIVIFSGVFVGLGLTAVGTPVAAGAVVTGVLTGAICWWALLTGGVAMMRDRITPGVLRGVNIGSGLILAGFAVVTLWSLL